MKNIKVLGSGCMKCQKTAQIIEEIASQLGIDADVQKETDAETIMKYGVMSTPAVVVDDQLVHSGSIPHRHDVEQWLKD